VGCCVTRGLCAITNPLVNSYKRLVPGYEAPVNVAWSCATARRIIRVPERRGTGTRVELRMPGPVGQPVPRARRDAGCRARRRRDRGRLARAGDTNIFEMSFRESAACASTTCRTTSNEACDELEKDDVITDALGAHVTEHFLHAKREEWREYITQVSAWELERYLARCAMRASSRCVRLTAAEQRRRRPRAD
jgi:glutamine synthetase